MILIVVFIFFIVICFIAGWNTLGVMLIFVPALLILGSVLDLKRKAEKAEESRKKESKEKAKREEYVKENVLPVYNEARNDLISKYGLPLKSIIIEPFDLRREIIVFNESKRVWICGIDLPFESILGCTVNDNPTVIKGQIVTTTKTNNRNLAKRAVVGDIIAGGLGAVIGGTTASKTSVTNQENDKVFHHYTIAININSLKYPILNIPLGNDSMLVNEVVGLMNVIIKMK